MANRINLPLIWIVGGFALAAISAAGLSRTDLDRSLHDTDFIIAHAHYLLSLAVWFGIFGASYLVLERLLRLSYSRTLAWTHLLATLAGSALIVLPILAAPWLGGTGRNAAQTFHVINVANAVGYGLTLAGIVLFGVVIVDAILKRLRRRAG